MNSVFTETYKVRSTQVNLRNQLGLYGIIGMLQDIASEHADSLGFDYQTILKKGFFWVLVQQKLKMTELPKWNEKITIKTWTLPSQGVYTFREFEIFLGEKKIGQAASTWVTVDVSSRKPIELTENQAVFLPRPDLSVGFKTQRVLLPETMHQTSNIKVKPSDLDVNLHTNNAKYTQWALDMLSVAVHQKYQIKEYDINFLSETFLGDDLEGYISDNEQLTDSATKEIYFYAQKKDAPKPAFISRCVLEKINP